MTWLYQNLLNNEVQFKLYLDTFYYYNQALRVMLLPSYRGLSQRMYDRWHSLKVKVYL